MTAKEFLFSKGITDSPEKGLFVKRDDIEFTIADLMEEFAAQTLPPSPKKNYRIVPFEYGMHDGYLHQGLYYPKDGPYPKVMGLILAVMTLNGARAVNIGDYLKVTPLGRTISVLYKK